MKATPVDFVLKRVASVKVASIVRVGPWFEENLRAEFRELVRWAARQNVRPGRWIFFHRGGHRWEACLEYFGDAAADGRIKLKTLPAGRVASVTFDPDALSSRVVYHGLHDWTRERRQEGQIRSVGGSRELYTGDPWSDRSAWSRCEVQFLVRP